MIRIGIIHISYSSIRLTLSEIEEVGYFKIIDELKTPFKVFNETNNPYELSNDDLSSILSTIQSYKSLCKASGTNIIFAVCTKAFETMSSKYDIVSLINDKVNLKLRILSEAEEIHYTYLGIMKSLNINNSLIIEITGTTTSLSWVSDGTVNEWSTLPIGNISLTSNYQLFDRILPESLDNCLDFIKCNLNTIPWLSNKFDSIVLIGDIGKNIARIDKRIHRHSYDNYNNYQLLYNDIHEIFNITKSKDLKQRKKIDGLDSEMACTFFASIAIFDSICNYTNYDYITISHSSIRDGILYEYLFDNYNVIKNNIDYSIYGILNSLNCNIEHAKQVHWITKTLFDNLYSLHHINESYNDILKTASMLHDCGISINYQQHHKHAFYIILNSYINELSYKQLLMSASIAASHRFNNYHIPLCQFSSTLNKLDIKIIEQISVLLKIAEGLDRTLISAVKDIDVKILESSVEIILSSPSSLDVEIHQAMRANDAFKEIYNKNLIIYKK